VILAVLATWEAWEAWEASLESVAASGTLDAFLEDVKMYSNDARTCSDTDLLGNLGGVSYQTADVLLAKSLDCSFDPHKD
jgi:hypothetical protein